MVAVMSTSVRERRAGFAMREPLPWKDLVEVVQTAERTGYEAVFLPEIAGRETFSTLAGLAGVTRALKLGTGVVTMVARRFETTVMAAATVHELSGGRMVLGLGTGPSGRGTLARLRDYVMLVRAALSGGAVHVDEGSFEGSFRLTLDAGPRSVPVWIAALGPKAMRLAGEVADGVILNWCPPERVAEARRLIAEGAEAGGRDPASISVAVYVRACVGQEPEHALPALKEAAGLYASYRAYARQFEAVGLGEEAARASAALRAGRPYDVPEVLVRAVCAFGDAEEAAARLQAYRDAGADLPIVYPVPVLEPVSSIEGTLFALAPHPAVES